MISNSGLSPLTCPELYQSAYGIVLALRFAVAQTGHESSCRAELNTTESFSFADCPRTLSSRVFCDQVVINILKNCLRDLQTSMDVNTATAYIFVRVSTVLIFIICSWCRALLIVVFWAWMNETCFLDVRLHVHVHDSIKNCRLYPRKSEFRSLLVSPSTK